MHTNFSTHAMRDSKHGAQATDEAIARLRMQHKDHIACYGYKLEERLTGLHETSKISEFSSGHGNRGSSVRVPLVVSQKGYGYIEDRRPGANADPYIVASKLVETICHIPILDHFPDF